MSPKTVYHPNDVVVLSGIVQIRHVVIELYEPDDGWPQEGTPSDWLADKSVGWTDGDVEDFVYGIPLWRILFWKAKGHIIDIRGYLLYLWGFVTGKNKRIGAEFQEWLEHVPVIDDNPEEDKGMV